MRDFIDSKKQNILNGEQISFDDALKLSEFQGKDLYRIFSAANQIRNNFRGDKAHLCAITNAKSGNCPEDCSFCAQSGHHNSKVVTYPLIDPEEMLSRAEKAARSKTHRFCLVISGCSLDDEELERLCEGIRLIRKKFPHLAIDASLGQLNKQQAEKLKESGLSRYNHNIETTEDFYPQICTTHKYKDRLKTLQVLKDVGLEICCGGIFGLGETFRQRIEFAFTLKDLDVDCIPLNFLNPVAGTPLENKESIPPLELIKIVAIFRFIHPRKEIKVCGGRESNLKELQSMIFLAGSDSIIIGDYLTTKGNEVSRDVSVIETLGFKL